MDAMLKTVVMSILTKDQKQQIQTFMEALAASGKAETTQQIPTVGLCRITVEKIGG